MLNSRKTYIIFIATILILSISSVVYAKDAVINVDNLNVRTGPGTDFERIGKINESETYPIIQEQAEWVEIQMGQTTGWVSKEYVSITEDLVEEANNQEDRETNESAVQSATFTYDQTNIRSGPSTSYDILATTQYGETLEVLAEKDGWFEIQYKDSIGFIPKDLISLNQTAYPLPTRSVKNKKIIIDAGHGGRDVGAIGASGNYEKDYTLFTASKLKNYLEMLGAEVILTRGNDHYISLNGRVSFSNNSDADLFISIHYDSTPQFPTASGISSYYYSESDQLLAEYVHDGLLETTNMRDRGYHNKDFQVTRENNRPSILLELGFLSNVEEERNIRSAEFQEKIAQGIISGLNRFYKNY